MNTPTLSILVISYNTREMTLECLRSVIRETQETSFELIVLDNASADGSAEAISTEFSSCVRLIPSAENLGFAAGNNRASQDACGEFLLLLNPDTVVLDRAIDNLMGFALSQPSAGIWGGRTLFADGTLNPASCWSRQTLWSLLCQACGLSSLFRKSTLFNPEGIGGWNRHGVRSIDIVSGCFLLIRRDLWQKMEGFRREFFMYGEEADLCLRAKAAGARPMVSSVATIVHHGGASEKSRADKLVRLLGAKMRLIHYHFPGYRRGIGVWLLSLWPMSRYWALAILSKFGGRSVAGKATVWREVLQRKDEWYLAP